MEQNTSSTYDNSEYDSALRASQRYLKRSGFLRGRRTGGLKINIEHIAWRNQYLRTILENRALPPSLRLREVYTDESYIHHHHHHNEK